MPSAPLVYAPLIQAQIKSTQIGDTSIGAVADKQIRVVIDRSAEGPPRLQATTTAIEKLDASTQAGLEQTINGVNLLVNGRAGVWLDEVNVATDPLGAVVNRTETALRTRPEHLDAVMFDDIPQAVRTVAGRQQQVPGLASATFQDGTLQIGPGAAAVLNKAWAKQPVAADEAAAVAIALGKAVEQSVTPVTPRTEAPLQSYAWLEDGINSSIAMWPGTVGQRAQSFGLTADPAKVDEAAAGVRAASLASDPAHRSVYGLLQLAGVNPDDPAHVPAAMKLLQEQPLEAVPGALAKGIAGNFKLPDDRHEWIANRIGELHGAPGNVEGLAAQLEKIAAARTPVPPTA